MAHEDDEGSMLFMFSAAELCNMLGLCYATCNAKFSGSYIVIEFLMQCMILRRKLWC